MPNDTIDRAIKKAITDNSAAMESHVYETYGPGGVAILIEALTDNRNKAAQDIKFILSKHGLALAAPGSASWAFQRHGLAWTPTSVMSMEDADIEKLSAIVADLEGSEEVQEVFTNAE
jgi:transcriptional/translational regulatory protein YebC/TACO1